MMVQLIAIQDVWARRDGVPPPSPFSDADEMLTSNVGIKGPATQEHRGTEAKTPRTSNCSFKSDTSLSPTKKLRDFDKISMKNTSQLIFKLRVTPPTPLTVRPC